LAIIIVIISVVVAAAIVVICIIIYNIGTCFGAGCKTKSNEQDK